MNALDQQGSLPLNPIRMRQAIALISEQAEHRLANENADITKILECVMEMNEVGILQSLDQYLTRKQQGKLNKIIARIRREEPLEYILGWADFYDRRFFVSKDTLIPRTETETLVDLAITAAHNKIFDPVCNTDQPKKDDENSIHTRPLSIIDVGTGTGCAIISTALSIREPAHFYATDVSPKALAIAQKNIDTYDLTDRITVLRGSLLEPVNESTSFDIVIANLPYIRNVDINTLPESVRAYEPHIALDGGDNGADIIHGLLEQAVKRLYTHGVLMLEADPSIMNLVGDLTNHLYPEAAMEIVKDVFGIDRFVIIRT